MAVDGWKEAGINDFFDRLSVPKTYDKESASDFGDVPILDQSKKDYFGYHNDKPDFTPDDNNPYVTFANHTCAVRLLRSPYSVIQNVFSLKSHKDIDPVFLFYLLSGKIKQDGYRGHWPEVKRLSLPKPPLTEQRKIAKVLESVDDAIAKTEAVIAQTQRAKQGLLQQLLTRGIGHTKFKQTELGEIPESWEISNVQKISRRVTSGSRGWASYYADDGSSFIRITNLKRNSIYPDFSDLQHVMLPEGSAEGTRTKIDVGDILISITADLGIIGYIKSLDLIGDAYVNQHIALVSLDNIKVHPGFIAYFLSSPLMSKYILKLNDGGAKAGLNLSTIRNLPIVIPKFEEQTAIYNALESVDVSVDRYKNDLKFLNHFKRGVMSDLLTGRVRVNGGVKSSDKIEDAA